MPIANYPFLHEKERHLGHRCPIWRAGMWLTNSSQLTTGLGIQITFILEQTDDYFYDSQGPKVSVRVTYFVRPSKKDFTDRKQCCVASENCTACYYFHYHLVFKEGTAFSSFANSSHCAFSVLFSVTRVLYTVSPEWSAVTLQASWCYTKEMVSLRKTNCCPSAFILTEEKRSVSAHLVILFIFRKGRLVSAKTGSEITDGPYRAGRAVVQPWGYHYSVAGCQGKASVLRSLSSDASHMYYDCEAEQQRGVIRLGLSPPGLIWMEFEPRLLCRPSRIQLLTSHSSGIS